MDYPLTRAEAKKTQSRYYFTGKPCKQGHVAPRATLSGTCVTCTDSASKAWKVKNPGASAAHTAAYRKRHREAVRERDRTAQAAKRAADPDGYRAYRIAHYAKKVAAEGREYRPLNRVPTEEVVQRLFAAHGEALQYIGGYTGMLAAADFRCLEHDLTVSAITHNVLRGANPCTRCNHMKSAGEEAVASLIGTFTPVLRRDRKLIGPKELDIYAPDAKLAVEYCGEFWHSCGSPEEEAEARRRHYGKYVDCKAKGVRLITLYEAEWLNRKAAIRRLLRNALGKSRGRLMARKCELGRASLADARAFFEKYHPQGGNGSGEHYALYWRGKMVACMRFTFGGNDRGVGAVNRTWTLSRYATRVTVAGAASRLFKAFVDELNPTEVKSFSDNRFFGGEMYERLGFALDADLPPDYQVWSPKLGLLPKANYQRRNLPARLKDHGVNDVFDPETDPRPEAEMTYLMGARRLYDCGKKRWLWKVAQPTPAC